ncbi:carboxypeptidase-like regulatory domain-containing protein [Ideonella azotifigens]|uniref:Carboxypeptidase regulatory-like domain-containing protein n=1 Tax=Ideonella azotifigens TaxID=513160 RepID=A0ABP3VTV5_9BURK|nr:carboxypeptidase-like regulatory domain-containing protein [Ideonella azotifigens]MCD2340490.1 carboxypeptidase-like regulatory domain-containing protein [Ideonella azotifigens]
MLYFPFPRRLRPAGLAASLLMATASFAAHAASTETEPNNDCASAQLLGKLSNGADLTGQITEGDVDYFQFTGKPGKWMEVEVVRDSSTPGNDMMAGIVDNTCLVSAANNVTVMGMVPADGKLVFAAAGYGDWSFHGLPAEFGSYRMIAGAPRHAYLVGTVLDGSTGAAPAYFSALVTLLACTSSDPASCTQAVNSAYASDRDGSYYLPLGDLPTGSYMVKMSANGFHDPKYTKVMTLGPDAGLVTLNFKLKPPSLPVGFSDFSACTYIKAGSECEFSYQVKNTTSAPVAMDVWAHTVVSQTIGAIEAVELDAGKGGRQAKRIELQPGEKLKVKQALGVASMPSGIAGTTMLYAALADHPTELVGMFPGFDWRITETGTASPLWPQPHASLKRARRITLAKATAADSGAISGSIVDASGQPVSAHLTLRWCWDNADTVCAQSTLSTKSLANGRYSFKDAPTWPAGRYQVWVDDSAYDQAYSQAFAYDAVNSVKLAPVQTQPRSITIQDVTTCYGMPAEILVQYPVRLGDACTIGYSLTNHATAPMTVDAWIRVLSDRTGSVANSDSRFLQITAFSAGKKAGFVPQRVTLQPGETRVMSQPVNLADEPLYAGGGLAIWVSPADQPLKPAATWNQQIFAIVP